MRIEPCFSPVWDTAIVTICLRESGIPADHPQLKTRDRMADDQGNPFPRRLAYKNPAKVEPSGWVFEFDNKWNPDVDDTAMVLLALRKVPTDQSAKSATNASSAA